MSKRKIVLIASCFTLIITAVIVIAVLFIAAGRLNKLPGESYQDGVDTKAYYTAQDFGIKTVTSEIDFDSDGVDDYTDIMLGAREYILTKPKYDGSYFSGGYPPEGIGVCTDVIWKGFMSAGYILKDMVNNDIKENAEDYPAVTVPDPNIDFRRVRNLKVFFKKYAIPLTADIHKIDEWQPGDIVVYTNHIAIVSDRRNSRGEPYIIHNAGQPRLEEDALSKYELAAHYRWKAK